MAFVNCATVKVSKVGHVQLEYGGCRAGEGAKVGEAEGLNLHVALPLDGFARVRVRGLAGTVGAASSSKSGVVGTAR